MSLNNRDARILFHAGFTRREIAELADARTPAGDIQPPIDLSSPAWLSTLSQRRWWSDKVRAEYLSTHNKLMSRLLYNQIVDAWYAKGKVRSPWDWIKASYRRDKKIDFQVAWVRQKQQARVRISRLRKEFRKR